jgi:Tol biopolymer transport system component
VRPRRQTAIVDAHGVVRRFERIYDGPAVWSADGNWLAFVRTRGGRSHVIVARGDGSEAREIESFPAGFGFAWEGVNPVWSPDGGSLAYTGYAGLKVWSPGSVPRLLARFSSAASWSPDSRRLAVARGGAIALVDVTSGTHRMIQPGVIVVDGTVRWSPRGDQLAFVFNDGGGTPYRLGLVRLDGSPVVRELAPNYSGVSEAEWSPDGQRLALLNSVNVMVVDTDGGNLHRIAAGEFRDSLEPLAWSPELAWSPDGSMLAFRNGGIRIASLDQPAAVKVITHDERDAAPAWRTILSKGLSTAAP